MHFTKLTRMELCEEESPGIKISCRPLSTCSATLKKILNLRTQFERIPSPLDDIEEISDIVFLPLEIPRNYLQ